MKKLFVFAFLISAFTACNKDKFTTVPQAEIKSFGPSEVRKDEFISFTAVVRDQEGDIDSLLFFRKIFNGNNVIDVDSTIWRYRIDAFKIPATNQFDLNVLISYGEQKPDITIFHESLVNVDNRYISIGLVVKDKAGNRSTYVESDKILLRKL